MSTGEVQPNPKNNNEEADSTAKENKTQSRIHAAKKKKKNFSTWDLFPNAQKANRVDGYTDALWYRSQNVVF